MIGLKKICVLGSLLFLFFPLLSRADENIGRPDTFKAEIVEVLEVITKQREDGSIFKQQELKLIGLDDSWKGREIIYRGISDIEVANINFYQVGDEVFVDAYLDENGETTFYITDFVRSGSIYLLFLIFFVIVLLVGKSKGFKALLGLFFSFAVIVKFILPQILKGRDPFIISLLGGLVILGLIIYLSEGFKRKSHIAITSVLLSLSATLVLSVLFTKFAKLSGMAQEESALLLGIGQTEINFHGLLLAGFVIGAIGVLDDIIIGQIEAVEQIKEANPKLSAKQVFNSAYKIGNTHLGAIVNTLFLTYAGAALPLLLLFTVNRESGLTFNRLINTEVISTEIIRTLVGSIGVILSMPIATFLAAIGFKKKI